MTPPKDRDALVALIAKAIAGPAHRSSWCAWRLEAERALAALEAAGVALVPVVATDAMFDAAKEILVPCDLHPSHIWDAMRAASPYAPNPEARSDAE